jgi:hypothetical protein
VGDLPAPTTSNLQSTSRLPGEAQPSTAFQVAPGQGSCPTSLMLRERSVMSVAAQHQVCLEHVAGRWTQLEPPSSSPQAPMADQKRQEHCVRYGIDKTKTTQCCINSNSCIIDNDVDATMPKGV